MRIEIKNLKELIAALEEQNKNIPHALQKESERLAQELRGRFLADLPRASAAYHRGDPALRGWTLMQPPEDRE